MAYTRTAFFENGEKFEIEYPEDKDMKAAESAIEEERRRNLERKKQMDNIIEGMDKIISNLASMKKELEI